jgi:hypothetical protein
MFRLTKDASTIIDVSQSIYPFSKTSCQLSYLLIYGHPNTSIETHKIMGVPMHIHAHPLISLSGCGRCI